MMTLAFGARSTENSERIRIFDDWKVDSYTANDGSTVIYYLRGQTLREADGTEPPARFTTTSPIAACTGNVVTTASGSKYHLTDTPMSGQTIHSETQYVDSQYLNSWIDGNNWLTI